MAVVFAKNIRAPRDVATATGEPFGPLGYKLRTRGLFHRARRDRREVMDMDERHRAAGCLAIKRLESLGAQTHDQSDPLGDVRPEKPPLLRHEVFFAGASISSAAVIQAGADRRTPTAQPALCGGEE